MPVSVLSLPTGTRFHEEIDFIVPVVGSERKREAAVTNDFLFHPLQRMEGKGNHGLVTAGCS